MIFQKLQGLIAEQFCVDKDTITPETSFKDDLGADSLDLVELVYVLEEEFDIPESEEEELIQLTTVGDVADFIANHGE